MEAYIKAPNAEAGDNFGASVSMDGDTLVVGAPLEDSSQIQAGLAQKSQQSSYSAQADDNSATGQTPTLPHTSRWWR